MSTTEDLELVVPDLFGEPVLSAGDSSSSRSGVVLERPQSRPGYDASSLHPHELALLIPEMGADEFEALKLDIAKRGVLEPVVIYEGRVLDGRHRLQAATELGIEAPVAEYIGKDPAGYVVAMNLHRRHLTREQRRDAVAVLLREGPEKSDRQIARAAKVSPTTVGTVRREMEETRDVSKLDTRTATIGRAQPARARGAKGAGSTGDNKARRTEGSTRPTKSERDAVIPPAPPEGDRYELRLGWRRKPSSPFQYESGCECNVEELPECVRDLQDGVDTTRSEVVIERRRLGPWEVVPT